jgi:alkylation response protein AidB-like acyl-CoA dehydrogenase
MDVNNMAFTFNKQVVDSVLNKYLLPQVERIDQGGLYPRDMLRILGDSGAFTRKKSDDFIDTIQLIESVGTRCATTAFIVWCHTISLQLLSQSNNQYLKQKLLSNLTKGLVVGSTGLSNAMKFYAGMESILLKGDRTNNGYKVSGAIPFVSNLGPDHWFAIIFETDSNRILALVPCNVLGLSLTERKNLLGMNGTATYSCEFNEVTVPNEWILTEQADEFIGKVRSEFILKQTAIPLGLVQTSLKSIESLYQEREMNRYLPVNTEILSQKLKSLRDQMYDLANNPLDIQKRFKDVIRLRLASTYLALETTQAEMLYAGAEGYVKNSPPFRRHRESLFFAFVTPTVKHLEKILR